MCLYAHMRALFAPAVLSLSPSGSEMQVTVIHPLFLQFSCVVKQCLFVII